MLKIRQYIYCFDSIDEANVHLKSNLNIECSKEIIYDAEGHQYDIYIYYPGIRADLTNPIVRETQGLMLFNDGDILTKMYDFPLETDK